jgi:2-methylisocitrate lyase-like PEP mutase family enzyme
MSRLAELAATLRDLHRPGDPVVLPNAWDPPSARRLAAG